MQEHITIMGIKVCVKDRLRANKHAQANGVCKCGEIVEVKSFLIGERIIVGLYSNHHIKNWSDLDGAVPVGQGLWLDSKFLFNSFDLIHQEKIVSTDFNFKKRNLRGMRCKVVHYDNKRKQSFVEFEENVGGGGADGLGKMGHCVVLPSEFLDNINTDEKKNENEKKSKKEDPLEDFIKVGLIEEAQKTWASRLYGEEEEGEDYDDLRKYGINNIVETHNDRI